MYSISKETVVKDPYFNRKMKCRNHIKTHLDGLFDPHNITRRHSSEIGTPLCKCSKKALLNHPFELATNPNSRFGSRCGANPEQNRCNVFPHKTCPSNVNISN